jgi:hypothetical protein
MWNLDEKAGTVWQEEGGGLESEDGKQLSCLENPVNSMRRKEWTKRN